MRTHEPGDLIRIATERYWSGNLGIYIKQLSDSFHMVIVSGRHVCLLLASEMQDVT